MPRERWSLPKVLYLFCRYYGFLNLMLDVFVCTREGVSVEVNCRIYFGFYSATPILLATAINILFILRIHALYNRSLKMLICLCLLFILEVATDMVSTVEEATDVIHRTAGPPSGVHWPGCVTTPSSTSVLIAWLPSLFVALMFFGFTIVKFAIVFQAGHSEWSLNKLRELGSYSPILAAFVRDGTVFFFLIFTIVLVNTIATLVLKGPFNGFLLPWLAAIYSFSASRLVLNIRSAAVLENPTTVPQSFSLDFRRPVMQESVVTEEGDA
ncbi:hypothetical protein C8R47DRAFT_812894 [Mycena vitilis]|nr:hypothetical protein C8R47DRAFT_812894 [Mycena vitilis]